MRAFCRRPKMQEHDFDFKEAIVQQEEGGERALAYKGDESKSSLGEVGKHDDDDDAENFDKRLSRSDLPKLGVSLLLAPNES